MFRRWNVAVRCAVEVGQELLMSLRQRIENLGPYQSLLLLAVPTATVEPLKLVAVAVAGEGHWIAGTVMIAACYLLSLVLVERLFVIVKPKLLTIRWFATLWATVLVVRAWIASSFRRLREGTS
ncbi:hypothetical protein [Bradyrhizobium diazoefficiens]